MATAAILDITQATTEHEPLSDTLVIRTDSQAAMRAFLRNELTPNIRAVWAEYGPSGYLIHL